MKSDLCPCYSKKAYAECCKPFHDGHMLPQNALQLMRSRYAAYAKKLADYIIHTTHPANPSYTLDLPKWRSDILQFCAKTAFTGLDILEFIDGENKASVTFTAHLVQDGRDATFTEKSAFERVHGKWLYKAWIKE